MTKENKDALRKEELDAARVDLNRQISHFDRLGKGKPDDHEYNLTANGLRRLEQEWKPLHEYLIRRNLQ